MKNKSVLGILGAGKLGTALARLALDAGYKVNIAGSNQPEKIELIIEVLVPGATAMNSSDVIHQSDMIVLALPLGKVQQIPKSYLNDKIVIDAMNYWWEVDGTQRIPSDPLLSSSEYVAQVLNSSHVVKAFNHMGYHDLEFETHSSKPKVIAMASDDDISKEAVSTLIKDVGFIPLDLGNLKNGIILEPGHELFGANLEKHEFLEVLKRLQ